MREREIRYCMGTSMALCVLPVAEGVSDDDVAEIARRLTGLVYERDVTTWRLVSETAPDLIVDGSSSSDTFGRKTLTVNHPTVQGSHVPPSSTS